MKETLTQYAEAWALHAELRSERTCADPACAQYTVEDALGWCMFYLWAIENLEEP